MDLKHFKTDSASELEGVWVAIGETGKLKLARANNRNYRKRLQGLLKPHRVQFKTDTVPPNVLEDAVALATAETILLDWQDITLDENPLVYSPEEAAKQLKASPDFLELVLELSGDMSLFREQSEQEAGNASAPSSSGAST